jgi:hypothetical protein
VKYEIIEPVEKKKIRGKAAKQMPDVNMFVESFVCRLEIPKRRGGLDSSWTSGYQSLYRLLVLLCLDEKITAWQWFCGWDLVSDFVLIVVE